MVLIMFFCTTFVLVWLWYIAQTIWILEVKLSIEVSYLFLYFLNHFVVIDQRRWLLRLAGSFGLLWSFWINFTLLFRSRLHNSDGSLNRFLLISNDGWCLTWIDKLFFLFLFILFLLLRGRLALIVSPRSQSCKSSSPHIGCSNIGLIFLHIYWEIKLAIKIISVKYLP